MRGKSKGRVKILDLLQALSSFLQGLFQPFKLSSRVCHVARDLIGTIIEDSVETNDPQTRLNQLGVEAACSDTQTQNDGEEVSRKCYSYIWPELDHHSILNMLKLAC